MRIRKFTAVLVLLINVPHAWSSAADKPAVRARPPKWSADDVRVFFDDARVQLSGDRPSAEVTDSPVTIAADKSTQNPGAKKWSNLIKENALAMEVKRIHNRLSALIARAGRFKGSGNVDCRRDFSLLAMLFEVIADYDQEVRWQREAAGMHNLCAEAALACEKASDESLALAASVNEQLGELLSGQPNVREESVEETAVDRGQLMLCMELALEENISPWLASKKEFRRRKPEVAHQSQLLAMLAQTISREGFDFADDEAFVQIARELERASLQLTDASEQGDYDAARQAAGRVTQSCSECHEGYRG